MKRQSVLAAVLVVMLTSQGQAQTRGFVETFDTSTASDTWWLWADGGYYYPEWISGTDPFISGGFTNTWAYLFANNSSSGGKLTGNYLAARIAALEADVYADYPAEVKAVDLYFYSSYNSNYYKFGYWNLPDSDWYRLSAPLNSTNWWVDGIGYTSVPTQALARVDEAGIIAYPVSGLTVQTYVNLDNFSLIPELIRPSLMLDMRGGAQHDQAQLRFRAEEGQSYSVHWCADLMVTNWPILPGYTNIIGSNMTVTVSDTNRWSRRFYRVETSVHLSN